MSNQLSSAHCTQHCANDFWLLIIARRAAVAQNGKYRIGAYGPIGGMHGLAN